MSCTLRNTENCESLRNCILLINNTQNSTNNRTFYANGEDLSYLWTLALIIPGLTVSIVIAVLIIRAHRRLNADSKQPLVI
jgi:hypothetical protein